MLPVPPIARAINPLLEPAMATSVLVPPHWLISAQPGRDEPTTDTRHPYQSGLIPTSMQMNRSSFSAALVCPLVEIPVADEDPPLVGRTVEALVLPICPEDLEGRSRTFWKATVQSVVPFFPPNE